MRRDFSTWIKARITKYGFTEGIDYLRFTNFGESKSGGDNRSLDYTLTTDMAKHLAMVENNEKGLQVRRYFIECEKRALAALKSPRQNIKIDSNARSTAITLRMLAKMKDVYPPERLAWFLAKAASLTSGRPIEELLPEIPNKEENWLSPSKIAVKLGVSSNMVGRTLKALNLHGEGDGSRKFSKPISNKSQHSAREVISYLYDPNVVIPALQKALGQN